MTKALRMGLVAGALLLGGCLDMEYGIVLDRDLSGQSTLDMSVDMERIAYAMAAMQHAFSGEEGPPPDEQVEAMRQELLEDMREEEGDEGFDEDELRAEIEPDLPPGVELLSADYSRDGLQMRFQFAFAFDNVESLNRLHIAMGEDDESPIDMEEPRPFESLQVIDEGSTILVKNEPINPLDLDEEDSEYLSEKMIESLFEGLRVAFRIESPFDIVEHNATRVDGTSLYWEYTLESLQDAPEGIFVRYRK